MYKKLLTILSIALVLAITGCASNQSTKASSSSSGSAASGNADYDRAHKAAVAAADKAASVGHEWRDIRWKKSKTALIPMAEKEAAKGNYAKAIELLEMAKMHGELGYQQAMDQKNAGPRF